MTVGDNPAARGDAASADEATPTAGTRTPDERGRSRRRRFVAAVRRDAADSSVQSLTTIDEGDIPVLTDIVAPDAPGTQPDQTAHEPLADDRAALAAELLDALNRRLADGLPMLIEASLAEVARSLRRAIDATIAKTLNDFITQCGQISPSPAEPVTGAADAFAAGTECDAERSPHPV